MIHTAIRILTAWVLGLLLAPIAVAQTATAPQSQPAATSAAPSTATPKSATTAKSPTAAKSRTTAAAKPAGPPTRYLPNRFAGKAGVYYKVVWGVDDLKVKWAESGEMVRFSWHVLDPQLAQILSDKKAEPSLIDPRAGVSLVIPAVENIGQLRQSGAAEAGKSYWMAFSNKGRLVKRGDRVDVVVGTFRAQGLVVD